MLRHRSSLCCNITVCQAFLGSGCFQIGVTKRTDRKHLEICVVNHMNPKGDLSLLQVAEYRKNKQDARRARQEDEQAELDELQWKQDEEDVCCY